MIVTESILDLAECTLQDVTDVSWFDIKKVIEAVAPLIRSAALEEAAKVADLWEQQERECKLMPQITEHRAGAVAAVAERIRSLKDKP